MKKLMILAVAAIATLACSRNYEVNPVSEQEIGFGTWAESMTKHSLGEGTGATWTSGDNFSVSGYKTNSDNSQNAVFNDVTVTYKTDKTPAYWDYTPKRFWDQTATSYTFYAVSPAGTAAFDGDASTVTTGVTAVSNSISFSGNDSDILVANETSVSSPFTTKVSLPFNHIASLLDIKVKKHSAVGSSKLEITSISIDNLGSKGTFQVTGYDASKQPTVTWNAPTDRGSYDNTKGVAKIETLPTDVKDDGTDYLIKNLIVMPQELPITAANTPDNDPVITISYKIKDAANNNNVSTYSDKKIKLGVFDTTPSDDTNDSSNYVISASAKWLPGTHYIYTIIINANTIEFDASINNWSDSVNGYGYLIN